MEDIAIKKVKNAMVSVIILCKNNLVVSYEEATDVVIYDMDLKKKVLTMRKPPDPNLLEDTIEEYDVCALITSSISPDYREVFEEMGVKPIIVDQNTLDNVIKEIFVG